MSDRRHTQVSEVPVLVAGAGPAGLIAAITLARHGIETLVVDRRREPSRHPRATAISTRSMELLRSWGLEDAVRAGGVDVQWRLWRGETLTSPAGAALEVGFPSPELRALISPTGPACVPQDHLEPVLLAHLRSLGAARVRFGTEVAAVEDGPDGVRAVLRDGDTGAAWAVRARYLIGADGAHSTVRTAVGIPMRGPDGLERSFSALFRAPLWDRLGDRRYVVYGITHPDVNGAFVPAGPGDRWLVGVRDPAARDAARMTQLIRIGSGVEDLRPRIERMGSFSFAAQLADRFRAGRVFLAGDAAHRVTPRGGTGMNTAILDGYDLGWKLAWVLQGWAEPELMDTYEPERRPVGEHNVARSADANGSVRGPEQELHVDLGGRITHLWVPLATGRRSTLDLLGAGLTLFTGPEPGPWHAAAAEGGAPVPIAVRSLDAITARALGVQGAGALLVRPDGAPAGWLASASGLVGAVRSIAGGAPRGVEAAARAA
jgi:putative polyketide hydroxylase